MYEQSQYIFNIGILCLRLLDDDGDDDDDDDDDDSEKDPPLACDGSITSLILSVVNTVSMTRNAQYLIFNAFTVVSIQLEHQLFLVKVCFWFYE
jgi:hypothetical protein